MDILATAKDLLGITDSSKDTTLDFLKIDSENFIKTYCSICSIPKTLYTTVVKIIMFNYNRIDTLHLKSHNYSNVSETFADQLPADIIIALDEYIKNNKSKMWCY